jgi:hypothetical protein
VTHRLELGAFHRARIAADHIFAVGFIPCGMGAFGLLGREARDLAASEDFAERPGKNPLATDLLSFPGEKPGSIVPTARAFDR